LLEQTAELSRSTLYWHFPVYLEGSAGSWRTTPGAALRHDNWKLIEFFEEEQLQLYNLDSDIGEQHNLAAELPEKTLELHKLMLAWREAVHAPIPSGLNPQYGIL
jgi:arylsulfatase A-like enzyme